MWATKMSEAIPALHSPLEKANKGIGDTEGAVKWGHGAGDAAKQKPAFCSFFLSSALS